MALAHVKNYERFKARQTPISADSEARSLAR
jgi:hypothetical protein